MRGADDVRQVEQRVFFRRLDREHVERSASNMARFQHVSESFLVNQTTASTVHNANAWFGFREVFARQDVAGRVGQRNVQGDEVSTCEQLVELQFLNTDFRSAFFGQERIVCNDLHFQALSAIDHDRANVACADNAKCFAGQLNTHEFRLFPFASMSRCGRFGDLTCDSEHHRDSVLSRGDHVAEGRVHHDDTFFRGSRDVHVIDADTSASDDFEVGRSGDDFLGHFGRRADRETIVVADDRFERFFVFAKLRLEVDFETAIFKDLNGCGGEFVGNKNFGGHDGAPLLVGICPKMRGKGAVNRAPQDHACASISASNAHSSHGSIASMSEVSTVAPHQIRRPAGASR